MKREDALASPLTLMYTSEWIKSALAALVAMAVSVFAFLFASDSVSFAPAEGGVRACAWHFLGAWGRSCLGDASTIRLLLRVAGCMSAGLSAAICYILVSHFLFFGMKTLRMIEYYRIRRRLLGWTICVVLSMSVSRFFINVFVPFSLDALILTLACVTIGLVVRFLRTYRPACLIADYLLLGALSALSVTGVVALLASTLILLVAKIYYAKAANMKWIAGDGNAHSSAYGGYGSYGGCGYGYGYCPAYADCGESENDELGEVRCEAMTERLRLLIIMFFFLGFAAMSVLLFLFGKGMDLSAKEILIDWIGWYARELKECVTVNMMTVSCVQAIALIFATYRYGLMLDEEHWLTAKDVFRIVAAAFIAMVVLFGIGLATSAAFGRIPCSILLVPIAMQTFSCVVIMMSVVVFLVNLKCRRGRLSQGIRGDDEVRQYRRMVIPLLLFFDVVPWLLLAFATSYVWRTFV